MYSEILIWRVSTDIIWYMIQVQYYTSKPTFIFSKAQNQSRSAGLPTTALLCLFAVHSWSFINTLWFTNYIRRSYIKTLRSYSVLMKFARIRLLHSSRDMHFKLSKQRQGCLDKNSHNRYSIPLNKLQQYK